MNTIVRYILAVSFVLVLALPALAKDKFNPAELTPIERTVIGDDIVHYSFEVNVDNGPYGRIRLHRFIREPEPYHPIPNVEGVLVLPGAWATVVGIYAASLSSEHAPWDHSVLAYLAKNNIDVWGMDYAWALVPAERENFHFMKNWTTNRDARDAEVALATVRIIRELTGQGTSKLNLLGHSWGANVGYSVLSNESQKPVRHRNVKAFIPVDEVVMTPPDSPLRADYCAAADQLQAVWDSGTYADNLGLFLWSLADLAKSDPEGPSDMFPGFSNYQAFLYLLADPQASGHLWGGYFDENGVPTGLRFTDPRFAVDAGLGFVPYFPVKAEWEMDAISCGEVDIPGFAHIDEIKVPILYIGSAGDAGENGYHTLTLTDSDDISRFTVQLLSDEERGFDFGHADLFTAIDAENLVWKAILDWINAH